MADTPVCQSHALLCAVAAERLARFLSKSQERTTPRRYSCQNDRSLAGQRIHERNMTKENLSPNLASSVGERLDCTPENVEQGLAKLVLGLVELLRQLLERQAIRRMEGGSLTEEQVEQMGEALMKLEATIARLATEFGLSPADLNLDLGPLGRLLE